MEKINNETVVSISMIKLQASLFISTVIMMFGVLFLHSFMYGESTITFTFSGLLLFLLAMVILVCVHEAIHLLGFRYIGGVPWKELDWGVNLKLGAAYAHSKKIITVAQMKKVLLLPLLPTGLLPLAVGLAFNLPVISILGVLLTAGCAGDLVLYRKMHSFSNKAFVLDHPTKPQFTVYE
ncbi:DUF3267 domain-containing protein [Alteribacillus sp. HJP-4]|uniref:DUF3267 domain-containing protein n=1 Tax=Alteribacillus sp. HJP-4 TaxID=2775394 RepID=UPI0035CCD1E3